MNMERNKKIVLALAPILAIVAAGIFYFMLQTPNAIKNAAPGFTVETLDGKTISLADLRGKPVLLNFGASW